METKDEKILVLNEELRSVKKSFEVLLLAIEAEGVLSAAEIAERLMVRLEALMAEIKGAYIEINFDRRIRTISDDRQRLAEARAGGRPNTDAFIELVGRIERHIGNADREVKTLAPRKIPFLRWFRVNWKKMAMVAATAVVALGVGTALRDYMTRGKGLTAEYYDGTNFRKLLRTRHELKVDLDLNGRAPTRGVGAENISVRWTGMLKVPADGTYEFVTRSDDGVRLFLDDQVLIENWTVHRAAIDKSVKVLTAGPHPIKLEWFQRRGPAVMKLYWRSSEDAQPRLIEPEFLVPS